MNPPNDDGEQLSGCVYLTFKSLGPKVITIEIPLTTRK